MVARIQLYHEGKTHQVELDSRRYCEGCQFWTMGNCKLFELPLPPWAMPSRVAICFSAEAEARERVK